MRGSVVPMIFFLALALIVLFVSIAMLMPLREAFEKESIEQVSRFTPGTHYSFDVQDLFKASDDPKNFNTGKAGTTEFNQNSIEYYSNVGDDPQFCKDLRECIKQSITTQGGSCEIDLKLSRDSKGGDGKPLLFDPLYMLGYNDAPPHIRCKDMNINTVTPDGVEQQVCKFKSKEAFNSFTRVGKTSFLWDSNKQASSDLWFFASHVYPHLPFMYGGYLYDGFETLCNNSWSSYSCNQKDDLLVIFSMPGYAGDYKYSFVNYSGGGTVKMIVFNASVDNDPERICNFSMMVVPQPAIATDASSITFDIFQLTYGLDKAMLKKPLDTLPADSSVTLYQKSDYEGKKETYYSTTRYIGDSMNDIVSSLSIYGGNLRVTLYDDSDYGGAQQTYYSSTSYIGDSMNDIVSSMKIYGTDPPYTFGYYPRPYEHIFSGTEYKPTLDEIVQALRTGLFEWDKAHYTDTYAAKNYDESSNAKFIALPLFEWAVVKDDKINYGNDCWDDSLSVTTRADGYRDSSMPYDYWLNDHALIPRVYYNGDFSDYSKLKIVIALYKADMWYTLGYYGQERNKETLRMLPLITVCAAK